MGLLNRVQVNVLEVVSRLCTDDRITMTHLTVPTKHELSSVEKRVKWAKNMLKDLPQNFSLVDLLFLHGSWSSMSSKVIFRRNEKKCNKDGCKSLRL